MLENTGALSDDIWEDFPEGEYGVKFGTRDGEIFIRVSDLRATAELSMRVAEKVGLPLSTFPGDTTLITFVETIEKFAMDSLATEEEGKEEGKEEGADGDELPKSEENLPDEEPSS